MSAAGLECFKMHHYSLSHNSFHIVLTYVLSSHEYVCSGWVNPLNNSGLPVGCKAGPQNSESDEGHIVPKKTFTGRRGRAGQGVILYWCSYYIIKKVWIILISNYELCKREKEVCSFERKPCKRYERYYISLRQQISRIWGSYMKWIFSNYFDVVVGQWRTLLLFIHVHGWEFCIK